MKKTHIRATLEILEARCSHCRKYISIYGAWAVVEGDIYQCPECKKQFQLGK